MVGVVLEYVVAPVVCEEYQSVGSHFEYHRPVQFGLVSSFLLGPGPRVDQVLEPRSVFSSVFGRCRRLFLLRRIAATAEPFRQVVYPSPRVVVAAAAR